MAIAYDNSTTNTQTGTSATWSYTVGAGNNRILWVAAANHVSVGSITGITYAGASMTQVGTAFNGGNGTFLYLFYLVGPASGANNVVISKTGVSEAIDSIAISYSGASLTGQPDNNTTNGPTTTTSYSQSLTTVADNCWVLTVGVAASGLTLTAGSNTTLRQQQTAATYGLWVADSNSPKTPAGVDTLLVTCSSQYIFSIIASFSPAAAASLISSNLTLLRVG